MGVCVTIVWRIDDCIYQQEAMQNANNARNGFLWLQGQVAPAAGVKSGAPVPAALPTTAKRTSGRCGAAWWPTGTTTSRRRASTSRSWSAKGSRTTFAALSGPFSGNRLFLEPPSSHLQHRPFPWFACWCLSQFWSVNRASPSQLISRQDSQISKTRKS